MPTRFRGLLSFPPGEPPPHFFPQRKLALASSAPGGFYFILFFRKTPKSVKSRLGSTRSRRGPAVAFMAPRSPSWRRASRRKKRGEREESGGVEKKKKRGRNKNKFEKKKEEERRGAGSPGSLSHPLRRPVLSLTHRPTFYLTYLAPAFNIIRHSVCFYFNARDTVYTICR